ncbi:PTS sugar transporter subunit IIA [Candidatus Riflebacteria bacterium]
MVGIIVVCHGTVASSLVNSARLFFGELQDVEAVDYDLDDGVCHLKSRIESIISEMEKEKVFILTDLLGGSPTNICIDLLKKNQNLELFMGVNLPMVLEILFHCRKDAKKVDYDKILEQTVLGAKKGIINYREFIREGNLGF